jgi:EAL domain-containing protein (putative c-di-GMP-specific phosphodiesterase class I)
VESREFEVDYQPIVSLMTHNVIGVEALVRWRAPDGSLVAPDDFIPLAEDCGLIGAIGELVLAEACSQVAQWNLDRDLDGRAPLHLAVNLSTRQLTGVGLLGTVEATLASSGLPASLLSLEITESTLMEGETARLALDGLKALGATLVIDDFGTGYSSLVYLRRFPVDVLKIDKSFVAGMHDNPEDAAIVTGVIGLAQALGLRSVAEGVETALQLDQLTALGCEMAQGFHWSRPLRAPAFAAWLLAFESLVLGATKAQVGR